MVRKRIRRRLGLIVIITFASPLSLIMKVVIVELILTLLLLTFDEYERFLGFQEESDFLDR